MDAMGEAFVAALQVALCLSKLKVYSVRANTYSSTFSLLTLYQRMLLEAATSSLFGHTIMEIDADFVSHQLAFTENGWMLFYRLPSYLASAVLTPQRAVIATFERFAILPESLRKDQLWSVQQILTAQECVGIDLTSRACVLTMILWA